MKPPKPGVSRYDRPEIPGPLLPCEAMLPVGDKNASVCGRSGPGKGVAYLRVSGPSGPLTSVYEISLNIRNYCTFNAPYINDEGKE